MDVRIEPDLQAFLNERIAEGAYADASDFINEALRALKDARSWTVDQLRREVAAGIADVEAGRFVDMDTDVAHAYFDRLRSRCLQQSRSNPRRS